MILGFNSAVLYKKYDRVSADTFDIYRRLGCSAIEINVNSESLHNVSSITSADLDGFDYISVHASLKVDTDEEKMLQLDQIAALCERVKVDTVVLHPDGFKNFELLHRYNLPYAFENMDSSRRFGVSRCNVQEMTEVFEAMDVGMVLDINHCFTLDTSLGLADNLIEAFGDRIKEVHLSAYSNYDGSHEPLYSSNQDILIRKITALKVPIILEGVMSSGKTEEAAKEYEYVKRRLGY